MAYVKKTSNMKSNNVKPFCKVCKDAGKCESIFTSHFVKSEPGPKGKVVCPTLLALDCSFCHGKGHTVSYCSILKKRNKEISYNAYCEEINKNNKVDKKDKLNKNNRFDCLDDEDEEKNEKKMKIKEDFPELVKEKPIVNNESKIKAISYAEMAAKSAKVVTTEKSSEYNLMNLMKSIESTNNTGIFSSKRANSQPSKSWAEWSDSEDEDDDIIYNNDYYDDFHEDQNVYGDDDSYDDEDLAHISDSITCSNWRNYPRTRECIY